MEKKNSDKDLFFKHYDRLNAAHNKNVDKLKHVEDECEAERQQLVKEIMRTQIGSDSSNELIKLLYKK